jgi:hypothetical protein
VGVNLATGSTAPVVARCDQSTPGGDEATHYVMSARAATARAKGPLKDHAVRYTHCALAMIAPKIALHEPVTDASARARHRAIDAEYSFTEHRARGGSER